MSEAITTEAKGPVVPIRLTFAEDAVSLVDELPADLRAQAQAAKFTGQVGQVVQLAGASGVERVLAGAGPRRDASPMMMRGLAARLPAGLYRFDAPPAELAKGRSVLAWSMGAYRFDRYRQNRGEPIARLVAPESVNLDNVGPVAQACALARDMINTPANDMGPRQIETLAREVAETFGAEFAVVAGKALLEAGYPAIHAVGRAAVADRAPRIIELSWGQAGRPHVALIGKGIVFDTGGLDIKPSSGMRTMKKDMGGAAHALALGRMVMAARLPVRLTVLLPVAENAISGDSMRPGDVIASRKGLSIEIGNTDAEGRLVLADALARAGELAPDLTLDFATLTGAARAALGPEIPPFYTDDEGLAAEIATASKDTEDPLWRMPLWAPYEAALDSDIADLKNDPDAWAQAGSVTAALFLKRFAPAGAWAHFDIFAWNGRARPGWPVGAEVQAIRAIYHLLLDRYR
jgi:leucyl aminopeptidase